MEHVKVVFFAGQVHHLEHLHTNCAEIWRQLITVGTASFCVAGAALGDGGSLKLINPWVPSPLGLILAD